MTSANNRQTGCAARDGTVLGCQLPVDPGLKEQGWEWRCNAEGTKLRQIVDSYQELGFEVRLELLDLSALSADCMGCRGALAAAHAVLVRPKRAAA